MTSTVRDAVLEPVPMCLTPESARQIANHRADAVTQAKFDQLADKANEGSLSDKERAEYDRMLAALHVITILQARARTLLEQQVET